jgi:hypothetical protein
VDIGQASRTIGQLSPTGAKPFRQTKEAGDPTQALCLGFFIQTKNKAAP